MAWYLALIGAGAAIAVSLFRRYYAQKTAESENAKYCFECGRSYPDGYVLCPKCGIRFGT